MVALRFVAERRLNLARPLKAGINATPNSSSRQRRLKGQSSLTRRKSKYTSAIPALGGRAKVIPTLRVEDCFR